MTKHPNLLSWLLIALLAAPAVAMGIWWFVSESSFASLKDGDYACSRALGGAGTPTIYDFRYESTATVAGNRLVDVRYSQVSRTDGRNRRKGHVKSFALDQRHGTSAFTATVDDVSVTCEYSG